MLHSHETEWYAVMVKPHFEKATSGLISQKGYETYLPLTTSQRKWSDRTKIINSPLFPRYLFARFALDEQVQILRTAGVQKIVGFASRPTAIPVSEIESLRTLTNSGIAPQECDYLSGGHKVVVCKGPLSGMVGALVRTKTNCRVVVSIQLLQRSVYVEVDRADISPLTDDHRHVA